MPAGLTAEFRKGEARKRRANERHVVGYCEELGRACSSRGAAGDATRQTPRRARKTSLNAVAAAESVHARAAVLSDQLALKVSRRARKLWSTR